MLREGWQRKSFLFQKDCSEQPGAALNICLLAKEWKAHALIQGSDITSKLQEKEKHSDQLALSYLSPANHHHKGSSLLEGIRQWFYYHLHNRKSGLLLLPAWMKLSWSLMWKCFAPGMAKFTYGYKYIAIMPAFCVRNNSWKFAQVEYIWHNK